MAQVRGALRYPGAHASLRSSATWAPTDDLLGPPSVDRACTDARGALFGASTAFRFRNDAATCS